MIEIAVAAARAAGEIQRQHRGGTFAVRHKGAVDLVTEVHRVGVAPASQRSEKE